MPRLLARQQPRGQDPEPRLVDGLLVNGQDAMMLWLRSAPRIVPAWKPTG